MSSLTKMLHFEWARYQMTEKGTLEPPLLLTCSLPPELGETVITMLDGTPRVVRIVPQILSRTAFFDLAEDDEEEYHAMLTEKLFDFGMEREWGGVAEISLPTPEVLDEIAEYFKAYEVEPSRIFVGVIGFAALAATGVIDLPEELGDEVEVSQLTLEDLNQWMQDYLHVGKVDHLPVFFNPELAGYILFCAKPKQVGQVARAKDKVAVMVHNAERGICILKVHLGGEDVPVEDPDGSTEEPTPS